MPSYIVKGDLSLNGELDIQGSKNAVLPIMAAALLNPGITVLHNCPDITDVADMAGMLICLGCRVDRKQHTMLIDASEIDNDTISGEMVSRVRASVLLMGAMLARNGKFTMNYPGGCMIGARPVDYHLNAFEQMNVSIDRKVEKLECSTDELTGETINLPFPSVGATENILLAAVGASGKTIIHGAAKEPEIFELCEFLIKAGASITGAGSSDIVINGGGILHDSEFCISSDRIVAGTYACAAIATGGSICCRVNNIRIFSGIDDVFKKLGCDVKCGNDYLKVSYAGSINAIPYLKTDPYPGFPTDMQSPLTSVLIHGKGDSIIEETIFEERFHIIKELEKLGASIEKQGRQIVIHGTDRLVGARMSAKELRGGAALIIAGLSATGTSVVYDAAGCIERGYEDIAGNISQLGGKIQFE